MAGEAESAAGPQTEIVAKTQINLWVMLPCFMLIVFGVVIQCLITGIRDALCLLLIAVAGASFHLFAARFWALRRVLLDREGVTLLPRGISRVRARPFHFRWDEVLEVRRASFWKNWTIQLRLDRPWKFWTFHSRPKNSVRVPRGIWTNPQFAETLRAHVPAERIHADLAFDGWLSLATRYSRVFALVLLVCAAVVAGCSFAVIRDKSFIATLAVETVALLSGALVMNLCAALGPPAFRLVAGFLNTMPSLMMASMALSLLFPGGLALIAGAFGAAAGALAGAAIMVINSKKSGGWGYAGATFILAAAGFWCGWAGLRQISAIRVGAGSLGYRSPWTPKGDAFLMTEGDEQDKADRPDTECWYSSGLKLERRVTLPGRARLLALGQEAALFKAGGEPAQQLWFFPRHEEPRIIDTAPSFGYSIIASSDSRHALVPVQDAQGETIAWKICDLETGKVEPVNFPVPLKEITVVALRDDQTVLWLSGSLAMDRGNQKVSRHVTPPENGEFQQPGKPYVVWSWKNNSADSPAQIYAAKTQWLDWRRSNKPGRLRVCRVSENPPARVEYVALDFTQSPPGEAAISEDEFESIGMPSHARSFDGRFAVTARKAEAFAPAFIADTKTGREFRTPWWATLFGMISISWSPSADEFLMEGPELKLPPGGLWRWHHKPGEFFEGNSAVYLVDMDRQ